LRCERGLAVIATFGDFKRSAAGEATTIDGEWKVCVAEYRLSDAAMGARCDDGDDEVAVSTSGNAADAWRDEDGIEAAVDGVGVRTLRLRAPTDCARACKCPAAVKMASETRNEQGMNKENTWK
jgi:hypothetical protein